MSADGRRLSIAISLPDLSGGGAERLQIELAAEYLAAGHRVQFLLGRRAGELLTSTPPGAEVHELGVSRQLQSLLPLARWLRRERPDVLVSNMEHMNVVSVAAARLARTGVHVMACQHIAVSEQVRNRRNWQFRILPQLYAWAMPRAGSVVAVSRGVAEDLAQVARMPLERIHVVHNGVIGRNLAERLRGPAAHPWLDDPQPVILAVGRLVPQKDHATLLRAFAILARSSDARLIVLGEGPERARLSELAARLGVGARVALPGFAPDPLPSMRRARVLALSSRFEGFGNVLAEALACGTPVVSTDCPSGPAEILDGGGFGRLVPVGDPEAMAGALAAALRDEPDRVRLAARGMSFSVAACAARYMQIMDEHALRKALRA